MDIVLEVQHEWLNLYTEFIEYLVIGPLVCMASSHLQISGST